MRHFVIIAQIRTGYQLLASLLHSHPDILSLGEIFVHPKDIRVRSLFGAQIPVYEPGQDQVQYVEKQIDPYAEQRGVKVAGFKLNYGIRDMWPYIRSHQWKVIHLTRTNLLDRLISEKLAIKETKWNFKEYEQTITIEARELELYCEDTMLHRQAVMEYFPDCLNVIYEDLSNHTESATERVLQFLELEPITLATTMTKQRTGPQSKYVSNYRELYSRLMSSKSECRKFLTDLPLL